MARVNSFVVDLLVNCKADASGCPDQRLVHANHSGPTHREFLARSRELQPNINDITTSDFILDPQDLMSESWPFNHLTIGIPLCEFSPLLCLAGRAHVLWGLDP
jgi:hypothetical protein